MDDEVDEEIFFNISIEETVSSDIDDSYSFCFQHFFFIDGTILMLLLPVNMLLMNRCRDACL